MKKKGERLIRIYYKKVDPYLWTELAPVLEGSGTRRLYPRKGTSVDRVCVTFVAPFDRRIFLLFVKNGFEVGRRSLMCRFSGPLLPKAGREGGREGARKDGGRED